MSKKCNQCGAEIPDEAEFCTQCGMFVQAQQDPFNPYQSQPQPQYQPQAQPYRQASAAERNIKPVFIFSLIIMIFLGLRTITALSSLSSWNTFVDLVDNAYLSSSERKVCNGLLNSVMISIVVTIAAVAVAIIYFAFAARAKDRNIDLETRQKRAKQLFILSVAMIIASIVYAMAEIFVIVKFNGFVKEFDSLLAADDVSSAKSSAYLSLIYVFGAIALSVAGMIKTKAFRTALQNQESEQAY